MVGISGIFTESTLADPHWQTTQKKGISSAMDAESTKAMQAKLNTFIEEQGIPGVMPTMDQLTEAGLNDVVDGINLLGGIMRACKVTKLLMLLPKARKGFLNITVPNSGTMWGQKKKVIQGKPAFVLTLY